MNERAKKITAAIRCCYCERDKNCEECPYELGDADCVEMESNAIDLIERLTKQVEHLESDVEFWKAMADDREDDWPI